MNDNNLNPWIGNGTERVFSNGGKNISGHICITDLVPGISINHIREDLREFAFKPNDSDKVYVPIEVVEKRQKDERGRTHGFRVNTWKKPDGNSDKQNSNTGTYHNRADAVQGVFGGTVESDCPF